MMTCVDGISVVDLERRRGSLDLVSRGEVVGIQVPFYWDDLPLYVLLRADSSPKFSMTGKSYEVCFC